MYIDNELCSSCGNEIAYGTACPCFPRHDCRDGCWGIPSLDRWNDRTGHWYCRNGNDNCGAHTTGCE